MADALDLLHAEWRKRPDGPRTIALCGALTANPRPPMAREVGEHAAKAYPADAQLLLAVGIMYIQSALLQEAQGILVAAGKAAPREPSTYRWLGEVLLRRGDAERAEKVFERALQLGADAAETRMWLDRSRVFKPMQQASGAAAVEREVARSLASVPSIAAAAASAPSPPSAPAKAAAPSGSRASALFAPPTMEEVTIATTMAALDAALTNQATQPANAPKVPAPDLATEVRPMQFPPAALPAPVAVAFAEPPPPPALPPQRAPFASQPDGPTVVRAAPLEAVFEAAFGQQPNPIDGSVPSATGFGAPGQSSAGTSAGPFGGGVFNSPFDLAPSAQPPIVASGASGASAASAAPSAPAAPALPSAPSALSAAVARASVTTGDAPIPTAAPHAVTDPAPPYDDAEETVPTPPPERSRRLPNINAAANAAAAAALPSHNVDASAQATFEKPRVPLARDVLSALAVAGIFEPEVAALGAAAWTRPEKAATRKRPVVFLAAASVVTVLGLFASLYIVRTQRQKAFIEAGNILAGVEVDLAAAKIGTLPADEASIGTAFEKDSRSPRAALDWLRERGVAGLLRGGEDISFEGAIDRAHEVGVSEDHIAFARVAAFVLSGDTSAAIALLPKVDALARTDAYFELLAGAALDRAGDARAQERFLAAQTLDSSLFLADMLATRAAILNVAADHAQTMQAAQAFHAKYKDRAEGAAMVALAWARDSSLHSAAEPPEVAETIARAAELPLPLASVPPALLGLRALAAHDNVQARAQIATSLGKADGPSMAAWLGELALDLDDSGLAQRAALVAVSFSAVYPPARMLAARVELAGDRLDTAAQAVGELDPGFPAVGVVRAAVAYERLDADGLSRAFGALSPDAQNGVELVGLRSASDALVGKLALGHDQLVSLASDPSTWSDRIAFDAALDRGDLASAQAVAATLRPEDVAPLTQLRRARLARYLGHLDEADTASAAALAGAPSPRTLAERVFVLVARDGQTDATQLLSRAATSPLTTWLSAYVAASAGHLDVARARTASLDPPPDLSPLLVRTAAVMALAAEKDAKRGKPLAAALVLAGDLNPDVVAAAASFGIKTKAPAAAK